MEAYRIRETIGCRRELIGGAVIGCFLAVLTFFEWIYFYFLNGQFIKMRVCGLCENPKPDMHIAVTVGL